MQIRFFCWQSFVFPSFQFYTQTTEEEDVGKDWRTITFRQDHAIHLKKNSYCVFMCLRANRGECQHAVCHECHEKRSKAQKRSRGCVLSEDELMESCHHELRNLQICADMWWCTKDHLEVHIGLIIRKVVLSVRGCLMWGISEWGCFLSGKFVVSYFRSTERVTWECGRWSIFGTWMEGRGLSIVMFWLCGWTLLCHSILEGEFSRDFNRL